MAKQTERGRRVSPRTMAKIAGVAAIFVVGMAAGGACSTGGLDRDSVESCLPITTAAQLDQCGGAS
ncbi:hypothetical protein [Gordonia cholesterolivorans]|uniref:Uncharacterized protein n=1 Tax=Gordonia cholesterolivorans TaxID=559625 RepID=A0ABN3HCJ5_9ACTN